MQYLHSFSQYCSRYLYHLEIAVWYWAPVSRIHARNYRDLEHAATDGNNNILVRSNLSEHAAAIRWMENIMVVQSETVYFRFGSVVRVASDGMADLGEKDKGKAVVEREKLCH